MKILWLEDRPEMMVYDKEILHNANNDYDITTAETPHVFMSYLEEQSSYWNLLIIDILFPQMNTINIYGNEYNTDDGFETGLVLYEFFAKKFNIPTIFYTSRAITKSLELKISNWDQTALINKKDLENELIPLLFHYSKNGEWK